ncbi:restriction endonuclease subunit S [Mycoplasma sp. 1654_15]|uniref:restriction endonuclease subunit S n=1 Tax=Mycoplasma sp. 1654_15 TaxID=2725994 RepID=UPI00159A23CF|nr:restriction endonuclease subunit S [Mycoplasma sp. 1654_15]QKG28188.1 restriction endonuclease subunit S [Mycoplasma sp. 1654_15]
MKKALKPEIRFKDFTDDWIEGKVGDLFYLKRGKVILQNFIENNRGKFPVYSSQTENNGELGKINTYDFNGEFITWTTDGAHAGTIFYRNGKFSITDRCGIVEIKI